MGFEQILQEETVCKLPTKPPIVVSKDTPFGTVIEKLQKSRLGCAVVTEGGKVVGIFTDQDAVKKGLVGKRPLSTPVSELMTADPKVLNLNNPIAVALRMMHIGRYRHLPIVNDRYELLGLVSIRDIVFYLSENYPSGVYNLPPDLHQVSSAAEGA